MTLPSIEEIEALGEGDRVNLLESSPDPDIAEIRKLMRVVAFAARLYVWTVALGVAALICLLVWYLSNV